MHGKYLRIITAFFGSTWAIMPEKLDAMAAFLKFAAQGGKYSAEEVAERIAPKAAAQSVPTDKPTNIAVIPISGIIAQKASAVDDISGPGGTSTEKVSRMFRSAMNDSTVKGIIFDIDSPGGTVYGVEELASEIVKARGTKPIVSMINSLAASAAYWIASAADEICITPSGEAGSIGVYSQHVDISKFLESSGQKVSLISAGEFKVEGNPFEPLSEEAMKYIQSRVDDYYTSFTQAVARGRGVPVAKVRSDFGKGRVFGADEALKSGMVDRIATFDQTVQRLAGRRSGAQAEDLTAGSLALKEAAETIKAVYAGVAPLVVVTPKTAATLEASGEDAEKRNAARAAERRRLELS